MARAAARRSARPGSTRRPRPSAFSTASARTHRRTAVRARAAEQLDDRPSRRVGLRAARRRAAVLDVDADRDARRARAPRPPAVARGEARPSAARPAASGQRSRGPAVLGAAALADGRHRDLLGPHAARVRGEVAQQHPPEEEAVAQPGAGRSRRRGHARPRRAGAARARGRTRRGAPSARRTPPSIVIDPPATRGRPHCSMTDVATGRSRRCRQSTTVAGRPTSEALGLAASGRRCESGTFAAGGHRGRIR